MKNNAFNRPNLASAYCDALDGQGISNASSGLFLAGPRRVGKSTFLKEDLIPEAKKRNWLPLYVDLWANKQTDPALLIIECLKKSLAEHSSKFTKLAQQLQLKKIKLFKSFEVDLSKPGLPENITLADALDLLLALCKKPILLIIDEAQHALSSKNGINAMFALKSARDQLNSPSKPPELKLVFTGSNRDKLAQLVLKKEHPFFGCNILSFPLLGKDYTDQLTKQVNTGLTKNNQFDKNSVWEAFQKTGHRPEVLRQIIGQLAINDQASELSKALKHNAEIWHQQQWHIFENEFNQLTRLQQTVLANLIHEGADWSPFSKKSMHFYKKHLNESYLSHTSIQTAIQALRDRGFIWQTGRGQYALEDNTIAEWFNTHP